MLLFVISHLAIQHSALVHTRQKTTIDCRHPDRRDSNGASPVLVFAKAVYYPVYNLRYRSWNKKEDDAACYSNENAEYSLHI